MGMFCAPVVASVGNPPASASWEGLTQALMEYPGYSFGTILLAHLGTPLGWQFLEIERGDRILVAYEDAAPVAYEVVSTRGYALVGDKAMRDLETGVVYSNLDVYLMNQSYPYLSLETCLPNPEGVVVNGPGASVVGDWGRLFIKARVIQ